MIQISHFFFFPIQQQSKYAMFYKHRWTLTNYTCCWLERIDFFLYRRHHFDYYYYRSMHFQENACHFHKVLLLLIQLYEILYLKEIYFLFLQRVKHSRKVIWSINCLCCLNSSFFKNDFLYCNSGLLADNLIPKWLVILGLKLLSSCLERLPWNTDWVILWKIC